MGPQTFTLTLLSILISGFSTITTNAQVSLSSDDRAVLWGLPNFPTQEQVEVWQEGLKNRPDLKKTLLDIIHQAQNGEGDWEVVARSYTALGVIGDVPEDDILSVEKSLEKLATSPPGTDMLQRTIATGSIGLLSRYPNEKREELIIQFLHSDNRAIRSAAVNSLGAMGGEKSLPELRAYMEKHKPAPGVSSDFYQIELAALKNLERRMKEESESARREKAAAERSDTTFDRSQKDTLDDSSEVAPEKSKTPWIVAGVVAVLGAAALLVIRRK